MKKGDVILTKSGLDELKGELDELMHKKRPALVERIKNAREQGDLSENSDYEAAREEIAFVDGRIEELEEILHDAKIISGTKGRLSVGVGSTVKLKIGETNHEFTVVGEWEADPAEKKISHTSPLGKALMGRKKGEEIEVEAPAGKILYKVVAID